jgi:redox-sensing transcriptional repressor
VRKVDLSIELQILAFHEQRKAGEEAHAHSDGAGPAAVTREDSDASADKGPDGDVPAVMPA